MGVLRCQPEGARRGAGGYVLVSERRGYFELVGIGAWWRQG